ncbi:hypothetical protein [Stackebrandtia nassauensis]|uniref:Uncharacterized protein n=1 Tax=Stackebrandtia nassauensis (strain DSM 44728 / CIP 108903 / NRRL B-16338 / NBRC 102104 / LLR-40K-21) TaxID=446470 RepID=D3Q084_STANL|nr:hypothetical protein [Stackebrandtia nassauensis]ADD45613.1 hypothetical protein Snas_5987 [Stackebrandtia nassauensis DSM 44728]
MTDSGWATPGATAPGRGQYAQVGRPQPQQRPPLLPQSQPQWGRPARPVDETLTRPTYREPHRSTSAGVFAGAGVAVLWFVITAFLGTDLPSRLWVMLAASLVAAGAAFLLARYGDRGAAAGVAAVSGAAVAVVGLVVELQHLLYETWVLW